MNLFFETDCARAWAEWGHWLEGETGAFGLYVRGYRCDNKQLILWNAYSEPPRVPFGIQSCPTHGSEYLGMVPCCHSESQ